MAAEPRKRVTSTIALIFACKMLTYIYFGNSKYRSPNLPVKRYYTCFFCLSDIDCAFSLRSLMCLRGTSYVCCGASASDTEHRARGVRSELDQLSCELKRCRYAMQKRDIEVSKLELGRYAPKNHKNQEISHKCGRLGSSA